MFRRSLAAVALIGVVLVACGSGPKHQTLPPPARLLDLANWKLTLPVPGPRADWPLEIAQPELNTYSSEFFESAPDNSSVILRAPVFGMAQPGSDFARTELREMVESGKRQAAWANNSGRHTMEIKERITALPKVRPSIVAGQIHDADEYVVLIRLDGTRLYVKAENREIGLLDPDYPLGRQFTVRLEAADDRIQIFYDGELKVDYERSCNRCYFKAGAYLQANPESGKKDAASDDYGEVNIAGLTVVHSPPL